MRLIVTFALAALILARPVDAQRPVDARGRPGRRSGPSWPGWVAGPPSGLYARRVGCGRAHFGRRRWRSFDRGETWTPIAANETPTITRPETGLA
ncbi:MAG: hypothetical protein R2724_31080 [Bryobacterales bacterium]